MTETTPNYTVSLAPSGPLQTIQNLQRETQKLEGRKETLLAEIEEIDRKIAANLADQYARAEEIMRGLAPEEHVDLELNPDCKWRTERTKPDVKKMRELCPELLNKKAQISAPNALKLLEAKHGGKHAVQLLLRDIDPEEYWSKVQVNLTDLTKNEEAFCIDNGIITVTKKLTGEPIVMPKAMAAALRAQKAKKQLIAAREEE